MMRTRTSERIEFLCDVLVGAIEHYGYGFPEVDEYEPFLGADSYATIRDRHDEDSTEVFRIDLDVIARGIGVIRNAELRVNPRYPDEGPVWHNSKTGQDLGMAPKHRKAILEANRINDAGALDVIDYLAILECAVFGAVTYC